MKKLLTPVVLSILVWTNSPKTLFAEKFRYPGECYGEGCPPAAAAAKPAVPPAAPAAAAPARPDPLPDWPVHSEGWGAWQKVNFTKDGKTVTAYCHAEECQRDSGWWTKVKDFFGADTSVKAPLYNMDQRKEKIPGQPLGAVFYTYTTPYTLTLDKNGTTVKSKDGKFTAKADLPNESYLSSPGSGMWVLSPKETKAAEDAAAEEARKKKDAKEKKDVKDPKAAKPAKDKAPATPAKDAKSQKPAKPEQPKEKTGGAPVAETPAKKIDKPLDQGNLVKDPKNADGGFDGNVRSKPGESGGTVYAGDKTGPADPDRQNLTLNPPPKPKSVDSVDVPPPAGKDKDSAVPDNGDDKVTPKKAAGPMFGDPNFKYNAMSGFKGGIVGAIIGLIFGGPIGALIGFGVGFTAGYALNMLNA